MKPADMEKTPVQRFNDMLAEIPAELHKQTIYRMGRRFVDGVEWKRQKKSRFMVWVYYQLSKGNQLSPSTARIVGHLMDEIDGIPPSFNNTSNTPDIGPDSGVILGGGQP